MKVTCKKTGKDVTREVIKMLEKSITKGKYTIKTVSSSDPLLNDNMCKSFYKQNTNSN